MFGCHAEGDNLGLHCNLSASPISLTRSPRNTSAAGAWHGSSRQVAGWALQGDRITSEQPGWDGLSPRNRDAL